MNYGIVYSSDYGQTRKIAEFLSASLEAGTGAHVRLLDVGALENRFGPVRDVDHVIIGSPVYFGGFPRRLIKWLRRNRGELAGKPVSVFIVSMNAAGANEESRTRDDETLRKFIRQTGLQPLFAESFAGAVSYTKYGFLIKLMMKAISRSTGGPTEDSRDHELTDWHEVESFARTIQNLEDGMRRGSERRRDAVSSTP